MQEPLQVIYTPKVSDYMLLSVPGIVGKKHLQDPELVTLEERYTKVSKHLPELPNKVGVITYPSMMKAYFASERAAIIGFPSFEGKTLSYYPALDLLENLLEFSKEDVDDHLARFYGYRNISLLTSSPFLGYNSLPGHMQKQTILAAMIPDKDRATKDLRDADAKFGNSLVESVSFAKLASEFDKIYGTWEDMEKVAEFVKEKFERNKVSRNFPLYAVPPNEFTFPEFYTVNLKHGVDETEHVTRLRSLVGGFLKADSQAVQEFEEHLKSYCYDTYGVTTTTNSLEDLLTQLPSPKTIITDTHIVDACPRLADFNIISFEYQSAQEVTA